MRADPKPAILVVDDERVVRGVVSRYLRNEGHQTFEAPDGASALELFGRVRPGLVVLDLMLPVIDGREVCRRIRRASDTPVIMLTARGEESDRITGFDLGADDYVVKPFSPRELVARVRSVLRRNAPAPVAPGPIVAGDLEIDGPAREVRRGGVPVRLTVREFDLLLFLASHPRLVFSRDQLMDRVWGYEPDDPAGTQTVTVHVSRLREKLEAEPSRPRHLETVWGAGYRFTP